MNPLPVQKKTQSRGWGKWVEEIVRIERVKNNQRFFVILDLQALNELGEMMVVKKIEVRDAFPQENVGAEPNRWRGNIFIN
jgi:hypothetical protein